MLMLVRRAFGVPSCQWYSRSAVGSARVESFRQLQCHANDRQLWVHFQLGGMARHHFHPKSKSNVLYQQDVCIEEVLYEKKALSQGYPAMYLIKLLD